MHPRTAPITFGCALHNKRNNGPCSSWAGSYPRNWPVFGQCALPLVRNRWVMIRGWRQLGGESDSMSGWGSICTVHFHNSSEGQMAGGLRRRQSQIYSRSTGRRGVCKSTATESLVACLLIVRNTDGVAIKRARKEGTKKDKNKKPLGGPHPRQTRPVTETRRRRVARPFRKALKQIRRHCSRQSYQLRAASAKHARRTLT